MIDGPVVANLPHQPVVFLDRDGVINRDSPDYIKSWSEFEFLPRSLTALERLSLAGWSLIVISNQSAVGRRLMPLAELERIHARMCSAIRDHGGRIVDIFFCAHHPREGCRCRKPKPGLIEQARRRYGIDLKRAVMIGDSAKDIECGRNAGCGRTVLVKTGNGRQAQKELLQRQIFPDYIAADLYEAAAWIVSHVR